jgi:mediator of RNA polymerase II transcription subunit 12, fungi type
MDQTSKVFESRLNILLTWSVTPLQYGDHRPYVARSILLKWKHEAKLRSIRRGTPPDYDIQEKLFCWLDTNPVAHDHDRNLVAVTGLYGELLKHKLFSFPRLIQRLMARGESASFRTGVRQQGNQIDQMFIHISHEQTSRSHLITILHALPLVPPSLRNERQSCIYGISSIPTEEIQRLDRMHLEVKRVLPELFEGWLKLHTFFIHS